MKKPLTKQLSNPFCININHWDVGREKGRREKRKKSGERERRNEVEKEIKTDVERGGRMGREEEGCITKGR